MSTSSLLYLAAAGIGMIGIIDDDIIDISNLQRQIIYRENDVGMYKVNAAKKNILEINQHVNICVYRQKLNKKNTSKIIRRYDIIIDGTDNLETRLLINQTCPQFNKPYIYAGISEFNGQLSTFFFQQGINYKDVVKNNSIMNDCNNNGVLGVLPGTIGLLQATEVLKILTGMRINSYKYLCIYDAIKLDFYKLRIKKQKTNLLRRRYGQKALSKDNQKQIQKAIMPRNINQYWVIDIRDSYISNLSPIAHSTNIPINKLLNDQSLDLINQKIKNHLIYVYCNTEAKLEFALKLLSNKGFAAYKYPKNVNSY